MDEAFAVRRADVIVSNAGYDLFGAAEEVTDAQVDYIVATKQRLMRPTAPPGDAAAAHHD